MAVRMIFEYVVKRVIFLQLQEFHSLLPSGLFPEQCEALHLTYWIFF